MEIALPADTPVSATCVVETGSPSTRSRRRLVSTQNSPSSDDIIKQRTSQAVNG